MRYRYAHIDFKRYIEYYRLYLTKKMKERIKYQRYLRSMDQVMDVWYFVDHLVHDRKGYLPITQNLFVDLWIDTWSNKPISVYSDHKEVWGWHTRRLENIIYQVISLGYYMRDSHVFSLLGPNKDLYDKVLENFEYTYTKGEILSYKYWSKVYNGEDVVSVCSNRLDSSVDTFYENYTDVYLGKKKLTNIGRYVHLYLPFCPVDEWFDDCSAVNKMLVGG